MIMMTESALVPSVFANCCLARRCNVTRFTRRAIACRAFLSPPPNTLPFILPLSQMV